MSDKKTILIVEDDEIYAFSESYWLSRAGYNKIHVSTGEKAIETVKEKKENIDLILMDINLGNGIDGTESAKEILKDYDIPLLFVTAFTEKDVLEKTENTTAYGYVIKSADDAVLLASINMAFKLHKVNKELAAQKKALLSSEEKFSKAFFNSPDAISINRLSDGTYLEINEGFTRQTGFSLEDLQGHSSRDNDLDLWVNKEEYELFVKLLTEHGEVNNFEASFRSKYGSLLVGLISANLIELEEEKCVLFISREITDRKRIEEELRLSEQRFKGITDNLPGMVFQFFARKNGELGLYYVSDRSTELLGLGSKNMDGLLRRFAEHIVPEDQNRFFETIQASIESVSKWEFEGKFIRPDGGEIYLRGLSQPRQLNDELVFDGVMLDITEQRKAVETLKSVSKLQSLILENNTMGFAFVRNRIHEWVNPRFMEIFDLPKYQLEGVSTRTLYPDIESYKKVGSEVYPLLAEGKKARVEIEMKKGDGSLFWCSLEGKALDPSKPHDGSIWMFEDISERKHAQEALLLEKSITEAVFNSVPGLIYLYDDMGNLIRWNKKHEEMTGYSSEEISKLKLLDWFKGDQKSIEAITKGVNKTMETGFGETQAELQKKDGTKIPMYFTASYLGLKDKKYFAGIGIDITERKKIQEIIQLNEEKMKSIFSSAPAGIGIVVERTFTEFNDNFCGMLGYSREELLGRNSRMIYKTDEDFKKVGIETQKIFSNENYVEVEIQWLRKNGTLVDVLLCLAPVDKNDIKKGLAFTALDITERKQAEEAIRISEEKYRNLIDNMNEGLFLADLKTNITFANKALAKIHGYENSDDMINHSIVEFIAPELREESIQNIADHMRTREVGRVHIFPIIKPNGSRAYIKVRPNLLREGENVLGIMGLIEDVTQQMHSEEALRISEERFRQVSESAHEWIWEVDRDGLYTYSNSIVESILGYKPEELIGKKHFYDLWSNETKESLWEYLRQVFNNIEPIFKLENNAIHKNGTTVILETSGLPIVDQNGFMTGYRGADIDITERKKIENELRDREKKISSLFAVTPAGLGIVKDRNFIECNERFCEMSGYTRNELLGKSTRMIYVSDEEYMRIGKEMYADMVVKGYAETETQWVRKDGTIINGLQYLAYIDPNNPSEGATFIALDITERKRVEEQLQIKDFALRSSLSAIGLADMNGNIIFTNDSYLKMWGFKNEKEALETNISDYLYADQDAEGLHKKVMTSLKNGSGFIGEGRAYRIDGTEFSIQLAANLVYSPDGKPISIMASFADITERKRVENEIQKSYAILEATLESTGDGILVVDNNGMVIRFNKRFVNIWHIPEELYSCKEDERFLAYVTEQVREPEIFLAKVRNLYEQPDKVSHDFLELKDGRIFERYSQPELIDGQPIGRVWSFHDVTEQKNAERALFESEKRLRDIIDSAPYGANTYELNSDDQLILISANLTAEKILRLDHSPFIGKPIEEVSPFICETGLVEIFKNIAVTGDKFDSESVNYFDKSVWGEFEVHAFQSGHSRTTVFFRDVTEQRKAELLVKKSQASIKSMIENINASIWSVDKNYALLDFNSIFAEFMQDAYNLKLKRGLVQDTLPRDMILFWKSKYDLALSGEQISFEFSAQLKDDLHYYEARLNPIVSDDKVTGVSALFFDITERKLAETELEKYRLHLEELIKERTQDLEKLNILLQDEIIKVKDGEEKVKLALAKEMELSDLKSRFVSTASHEFRTPLTTILASADLLDMYGRAWPETKYYEYIHNIQNTVEYMTGLINDVLVFSKSETGKIIFTPSMVNLPQLIQGIIENSKLSAPGYIKFNFEYRPEQKLFFVDNRLVTQILSNLLSNSIKYSPQGGEINIITDEEGDDLLLIIADQGIGIPDEDKDRLFEPFNRAQNIGTIPGTGLGLSIVKKSVEIHEGKILVESKLNHGTKVTVFLKCR